MALGDDTLHAIRPRRLGRTGRTFCARAPFEVPNVSGRDNYGVATRLASEFAVL